MRCVVGVCPSLSGPGRCSTLQWASACVQLGVHQRRAQNPKRGARRTKITAQATLDVLRRTVRESSGLRLKVLITGSLYMVGDMLNILNIKNP